MPSQQKESKLSLNNLHQLVEQLDVEHFKFDELKNKRSATRSRNKLSEISKLCKLMRAQCLSEVKAMPVIRKKTSPKAARGDTPPPATEKTTVAALVADIESESKQQEPENSA